MALPRVFTSFRLLALALLFPALAGAQEVLSSAQLSDLEFRSIGPAVAGGRIHDVEALPDDPATVYVATASGGIWKSVNKGTTWTPIFEGMPVSTFGDLELAPSNPNIIYAGTGEQNNRQSTSWGNGVYRSDDAGATWRHLGLEKTRHIGRVRIHPQNPDIAYVAALGNLWKASPERGVYKTTDGGESWEKVLYVDTLTGAVDLVMDPSNPGTLYAAMYQRLRTVWGFNGGGPGSGIYKTTDGGETWVELTNGIPEGDKGRIGLAIAPSNPSVLNATIEHATGQGTYRTEDGGTTWTMVSEVNPRPMYYSHIYIDPNNEELVYVIGQDVFKSQDGGDNFVALPTSPTYDVGVHSDHHSLWLDPSDVDHFYLGGDGGLHETWDGGLTFRKLKNLPIGQFYAIGLDNRMPYRIYGGMQDNHSWMGPNATRHWLGILNGDWQQIGFGDGMYQSPDPTTHRYVYSNSQGGSLTRMDAETGDIMDIGPRAPAGEPDYRFDWTAPSLVSQHNPEVVYFGGNRLFISRDRGVSWNSTEDLTRQIDRDTLSIMGVSGSEPMLSKNDGESSFSEITTIAESPLSPDILWVGTDDGNVQVSRDGGASWTNVSGNLMGVPDGTYVSRVLASGRSPGSAYVTLDGHRRGDFAPYVLRTDDFGATWTPLMDGLPSGSVNVIEQHPYNPDLLFLGTEHALWMSTNGGAEWTRVPGLPTTLYDDLAIHPRANDLVVATHGRSIYILDDLTPLEEWNAAVAAKPAHLFSIMPATIFHYWKDTSYRGHSEYAGENPPFGAILNYHLAAPVETAQITVTNASGDLVRTLDVPETPGAINRVVWDLRHEPPPSSGRGEPDDEAPELPHPLSARGPFVSPGTYTVTLTADGAVATQTVEVRGDPQMPITAAQYAEREAFLVEVLAMQNAVSDLEGRTDDASELRSLRRGIYSLAEQLNGGGVAQGTLYPPTAQQRKRKEELQRALEALSSAAEAAESINQERK